MICKYYLPWTTTSTGEINDACVDNEKRTIRQCEFTRCPEGCPKFEPYREYYGG